MLPGVYATIPPDLAQDAYSVSIIATTGGVDLTRGSADGSPVGGGLAIQLRIPDRPLRDWTWFVFVDR
jgi:hypothetical protein